MSFISGLINTITIILARCLRFLTPRAWRYDVLTVKLSGELPEDLPHAGFVRRFMGHRIAFRDYLFALKLAKNDPHLRAVVLQIRDLDIGWARAWELREIIKDLRSTGLAVTAYLENADNISYYIASACDEIFMAPSGQISIRGLAGEVIFVKRGLDKLGIKAELEFEGKYKSAHEMFTRTSLSEEHREELEEIIDDIYKRWISDMAADRRIGERRMKSLVDKGSYMAADAKKAGLADRLCYFDEIDEIYDERLHKRVRTVSVEHYPMFRSLDNPLRESAAELQRIAIVYATGPITSGVSSDFGMSGGTTGADSIVESIRDIREDRSIAGIVLRIDSPGGSAFASDLIWRELFLSALKFGKEFDKNRKPLVVSMGDVAASGGYYIACCADKIFVDPTTITGSIGVIGGKFSVAGLAETLGVDVETVTRGKVADMDNLFRAYSEGEKKILQHEVKTVYKEFIERVGAGRAMPETKVNHIAKGRVWLGSTAVDNGLADSLGGLLAALDEVKKLADIPLDEKAAIDIYPKRKRVIRLPFAGISVAERTRSIAREALLSLLPAEIGRLAPLMKDKGPLAIMSYILRIR